MDPVLANVITAVAITARVLELLIIIRAFMSFFPRVDDRHPVVKFLRTITDPILTPFQRMVPAMAGLDFSPILALLTLRIASELLIGLLRGLMGA